MKKIYIFYLCLLGAMTLTWSGCTDDKSDMDIYGTINGTVYDKETGLPLPSATVTVKETEATMMTNDQGLYSFKNLESGTYQVTAKKAGYMDNYVSVNVKAGESSKGDILLEPGKPKIELNTKELNFGASMNELTLEIKNVGTKEDSYRVTSSSAKVTVSPATGSLAPGKAVSVVVKVDRSEVFVTETANLVIACGGESVAVTVNIEPETQKWILNTDALNFGSSLTELSFIITNKGAQNITWRISTRSNYITSVSPESGTISPNGNVTVFVKVDRSSLTETESTVLVVTVDGFSRTIPITIDPETVVDTWELSKTMLDFGTEESELVFDIKNTGNKKIDFNVSTTSSYVTFTPSEGTVEPGKKQVVVVKADRSSLTQKETLIILVEANGETKAVTANIEPVKAVWGLDKASLDFGSDLTEQVFTIQNKGTKGCNFSISTTSPSLTITPITGMVDAGKQQTIVVKADRSNLTQKETSTILVEAEGESQSIAVSIDPEVLVSSWNVDVTSLDFGTKETKKTFQITNTGTKNVDYTISFSSAQLVINPVSGTILPNEVQTINVQADRNGLTSAESSTITITGNNATETITVKIDVDKSSAQQVVTNGLYAYYTFEENTKDLTENGMNGSAVNGPVYVVNTMDGTKAIKFNRSAESYFSVPDGMIDQNEFTISFWAKDLSDGHIFHVVKNIDNPNRKNAFCLSMVDGKLKFTVKGYNNGYPSYDSSVPFNHGTITDGWHMITLASDFGKTTYATVTTRLYIDGEFVDQTTEECNPFDQTSSTQGDYGQGVRFIVGGKMQRNSTNVLNALNMTVDNLRVYDSRRLSTSEIQEIYQAEH